MQNFSFKRLTAWLLTFVMLVSLVPANVSASVIDEFLGDVSAYFRSQGDSASASGAMINAATTGMDVETFGSRNSDPVVVIAGSDYQQSGTAPKKNVENILKAIVKDYKTADGFMFGGDYSQTINNNATSTTSGINELKGVVQEVYGTALNEVYVQGNHDAAVKELTATGAHDTKDYGVFSINEDNFSSSYSGGSSVSNSTLTALDEYLNAKVSVSYTKPIFVITHLPLHATSRNDNTGANAIFTKLNAAGEKGLNIIFLFGHNHSQGYDAYLGNGSIYLPKGSSINVAGGSTSTLNFTYMNYGYVGYVSGNADTALTMSVFEITDTQVAVKRYDANGLHNLKAAGATVSGYNTDSNIYGTAVIDLSTGESTTSELGASSGSTDSNTNTGTGTGGTVTPSGGDWKTISDGSGKVVYKLDKDGVDAGSKYLIVSDDEAIAMSTAANSSNGTAIEFNSDETEAYSTSTALEWTIETSDNGYKMYNTEGQYIGRSSSSISNDNSDVWSITGDGEGAYTIKTGNYVLRYSGSNSAFRVGSSYMYSNAIRLYKYDHTDSGVAEYAKLDGELTYTVARGASGDEALAAVMNGINVLTSASADGSNPTTLDDSNTDIKWTLADNYDGSTPGEYAVTITYKDVTLGTAKVVVPDTAILCEDILYYIDDSKTAPITASVTEGTPEGTYSYEIVDGGDVIESVDANGIIHFTGTDGTAKVKITYTYSVDGTAYTLEKVINVTAKNPYFDVEICDPVTVNGTTTYEPITAPIALKGVETGDIYSIWAVVKEYNGQYPNGNELENVASERLSWTVSDPTIASIDPVTGVITFTGVNYGTFDVTVYYLNEAGTAICEDTIIISVTESQYTVPGDGTNDFPEYPNQGAIRFDKTAVAQGNFSQSGIAKVELSMTGVPYGSSVPTDVVIMVDMTTSMYHYDYIDDANAAIKNMLEALVYDEENDAYDENIFVQVWSFKSDDDGEDVAFVENLPRTNITSAADLLAAQNAIAFDTNGNDGSGTCYDEATKKMHDIVKSCTTENVVAVFASDGGPSRYSYLNADGGVSEVAGSNASLNDGDWFNNDGSVTSSYKTEYYTYLLKTQNIPVYTVGVGIDDNTDEAWILEHMSSEYDPSGKTISTDPANATTDYFALADINTTPDALSTIFAGIAASIREAATDVVVEDKIDSHYTMNFSLPSGVTAAEAGMEEFYMQVLSYELDDNNNRKDNPTVLENFTFDGNGALKSHTVNNTACGEDCSHVTKTGSTITGIDGTYFDYEVDANGDEFLTWEAEKLDRNELALEYFVYLDNSAGVAADKQVDAGTYPTNEYATITYKNFNGKECQQKFPVPTMTWNGAKVTYTFYLVNDAGQPVNRAGKVIPFAEAIYVTDPVTYDVTWNEEKGIERLSADYLANGLVPDVYELYDQEAYYEIRVYQDETQNSNYFVIRGADGKQIDSAMDTDTTVDNSTTKVYNTKAGIKYDEYGVYSQQDVGTELSTIYVDADGAEYEATITTTVKTESIDYANTTVAFAVVWKPELNPDTVVIDYGLDVVIDVATNDALAAGVTGVSNSAPVDIEINKGTYSSSKMGNSVDIVIDDYIIGTAKVENLTSVRFSMNPSNGMRFKEAVTFFYESECNYYTYNNAGDRTLNTNYMYSSVTVIPATTIYYEETFLTFEDSDVESNVLNADGKEMGTWYTYGSIDNKTQSQDRPGESQISGSLDADNVYGYDPAYSSYTTYSLGAAEKVTVNYDTAATPDIAPYAQFTFTGSGFDIVSLTDYDSGVIRVQAFSGATIEENEEPVKTMMVNNYYGYTYDEENDKWVVDKNSTDTIYQVPVIKMTLDKYATYTVKIQVAYLKSQDMRENDSYSFWMDAVRIYDPANDGAGNEDIKDAYEADHEYDPHYLMIRNAILNKEATDRLISSDGGAFADDDVLTGTVFIDGRADTSVVSDYENPGPNNEAYLAGAQGISFKLKSSVKPDKVHLGAKLAFGSDAPIKVVSSSLNEGETVQGTVYTGILETTSDMYYDITEFVHWNGEGPYVSDTITISNTNPADSDNSVISLTNLKVTYPVPESEESQEERANQTFTLRRSTDEPEETTVEFIVDAEVLANGVAVMNALGAEEVPEVFTPELFEADYSSNRNGKNVTVTVTASTDVEVITINGIEMSRYKEKKGVRTWTYKPKNNELADLYEIVAFNADGLASEPIYAGSENTDDLLGAETYINRMSQKVVKNLQKDMEKLANRIFTPEKFNKKLEKLADGAELMVVNTSEDVEYIIADGEILRNYITETIIDLSKDGEETVNRVWLVPNADDNAEIAAYNAEGVASEGLNNG